MAAKVVLDFAGYLEIVLGIAALFFIFRQRYAATYWPFTALLITRISFGLLGSVLIKNPFTILTARTGYNLYFYSYWLSFGAEAVFAILTICLIYRNTMAPLKGLQSLGMLMFQWAAAISTAIALAISIGPHVKTASFLISAVGQMQRASSVLTLCLLLFVCFAIKPLGMTFRSRTFGVSLGLGVLATINMVQSAWIPKVVQLYTIYSLVDAFAVCAALGIWIGYFALPEPQQRMVLLPTDSPFLRWNHISEVLGHNPGYVAIGPLPAGTIAPAEFEIMRLASVRIAEIEREEAEEEYEAAGFANVSAA